MAVHISQLPQSVKDRLGLKDTAYKQFWAIVGDKDPIYFRSSWEYYYAIFLEKLKQEGKIVNWKHEPLTFWFHEIKRGVRSYLPDFCVLHLNGTEEWIETKGLMDSKSQTKMKRMAKYYPQIKIRLVGSEWFKINLKACKALEAMLGKLVQKVS
jgi:hypothetical protein